MAKTTVERTDLKTPDGNIACQLSGEDGHLTLTITSKTGQAFFDKIVLIEVEKADPEAPATRREIYLLNDLLADARPTSAGQMKAAVDGWRNRPPLENEQLVRSREEEG